MVFLHRDKQRQRQCLQNPWGIVRSGLMNRLRAENWHTRSSLDVTKWHCTTLYRGTLSLHLSLCLMSNSLLCNTIKIGKCLRNRNQGRRHPDNNARVCLNPCWEVNGLILSTATGEAWPSTCIGRVKTIVSHQQALANRCPSLSWGKCIFMEEVIV